MPQFVAHPSVQLGQWWCILPSPALQYPLRTFLVCLQRRKGKMKKSNKENDKAGVSMRTFRTGVCT